MGGEGELEHNPKEGQPKSWCWCDPNGPQTKSLISSGNNKNVYLLTCSVCFFSLPIQCLMGKDSLPVCNVFMLVSLSRGRDNGIFMPVFSWLTGNLTIKMAWLGLHCWSQHCWGWHMGGQCRGSRCQLYDSHWLFQTTSYHNLAEWRERHSRMMGKGSTFWSKVIWVLLVKFFQNSDKACPVCIMVFSASLNHLIG